MDLAAALATSYLMRGLPPVRILQAIASGLLGTGSYRGGLATAALGVVLHFLIAFGAAGVFYGVSRKLRLLTRQAVVSGLPYGVAVFFFMNLVVLPLSAFPHEVSFRPAQLVSGLIVHALCVGLPIALATRVADGKAMPDATGRAVRGSLQA